MLSSQEPRTLSQSNEAGEALPVPATSALPSSTTTAASSRRPSVSMLNPATVAGGDDECRRPSLSPSTATSSSSSSSSSSCHSRVDRVSSISHVVRAIRLTWSNKRSDLFTAWIHVPIGITALLAFVWVIKLGMDKAPFRFPSPVLAMVALFAALLILDRLSTCSVVQTRFSTKNTQRKPLLAPVLAILEPPCDFCLRYMSVMFTPSFILIPARELIDGREIGYIAGWFAATQLVALVFPVFLHRAIHAVKMLYRRGVEKRQQRAEQKAAARRASLATIVSIADHVQGTKAGLGEKDSTMMDPEKLYDGVKLGKIAQGLSGVTAVATAPLVVTRNYRHPTLSEHQAQLLKDQTVTDEDQQRHITHVQMETARQQGDPYVTSPCIDVFTDPSHVSRLGSSNDYAGVRPHHFFTTHRHQTHRSNSERRSRSASRQRPTSSSSTKTTRPTPRRPSSAGSPGFTTAATSDSPFRQASAGRERRPTTGDQRHGRSALRNQFSRSRSVSPSRLSPTRPSRAVVAPIFNQAIFEAPRTASPIAYEPKLRPDELDPVTCVATPRASRDEEDPQTYEGTTESKHAFLTVSFQDEEDRRTSEPNSDKTLAGESSGQMTTKADQDIEAQPETRTTFEDGDEDTPDAVERLSERIADAITPTLYALVLVVGLPLFYLVDISLPLFLAINLLTFLAAITVVPPKIRRYAHPILTSSIATVLIIWGLGEARGWPIKQTLASYSVDAKYSDIWILSGYNGPVIGAGDVLFSTLDAGIVSLAIPMYRYRRDLYNRFTDMLVVLFPCAMLSLFVWPSIAHLIGIAPERSLAFASRFMSTPLAIELSLTIGADESITVILVVITGILISVFKDQLFRLLRVDPNDSLTIGIAMGSTAGAIGASSLISKPKTMAIASLSFVLFGTILLIFAAIPPVVEIVRSLAGASMPI